LKKPDFDQYDFKEIPLKRDEEVENEIQRLGKRIQTYKKSKDYLKV
jgi:hypothetical protein